MFRRPLIAVYFLSAIIVSCRSSRPAVTPVAGNGSAVSYIEVYKDLAVSEMRRTGIPASITLAQGMIESGNGKSRLAVEANNHFGIKCHNDWKGPTIKHSDDRRNECFRKYKTPAESFRDHSDFLKNTPRYSSLFELEVTDYRGWAKGLKKTGYATNPDYANMLIRKIEEYGLNNFDSQPVTSAGSSSKTTSVAEKPVLNDTITPGPGEANPSGQVSLIALPARVKENNRIQYIIVRQGDTPGSIEKEMELLPWELQRYNELEDGYGLTEGQILYLQPKRDKAEAGKEQHIAKQGETMYMISQIYGIRLKQLYYMNRMEAGDEPVAGQKIWLRKIRPLD